MLYIIIFIIIFIIVNFYYNYYYKNDILYIIKNTNNINNIIDNINNNKFNDNKIIDIIFECIYHNKYKKLKKILLIIKLDKFNNYFYKTLHKCNYLDNKLKCFKILLNLTNNIIDHNKLYNSISLSQNNNKILNYIFKLYNHKIIIYYYDYNNNFRLDHCLIKNYISPSLILKNYINNIDDIKITRDKLKKIFIKIDKLYYRKIIIDIINNGDINCIDYIFMKLNKMNLLENKLLYIKKEDLIILDTKINININIKKDYWYKILFNKKINKIIKNNNLINLINIIDKYNILINKKISYIQELNIITNDIIKYNLKDYII